MENKIYGRLTAVSFAYRENSKDYWLFKCICGNYKTTRLASVQLGSTQSCGCFYKDTHTKHGYASTENGDPIYQLWLAMINRCTSILSRAYPRYGGRGITVCSDWMNFKKFKIDMGERPDELHTLERVDNNGNYCKDNCIWATRKDQANNRSSNKWITIAGINKTLSQWLDYSGRPRASYYYFLRKGYSIEEAIGVSIKNLTSTNAS